jgi:aminoglycoside phosphotransferase family enzyme/predicted kinase
MGSLKQDLIDQGMALRETHISLVFLGEREVYKVKKPVQLGFLDFSTLALRKACCEAEVRLNQRLAADVYLGTAAIVRDVQGVHRVGAAGEPVEWAVVMRKLPDAAAADQRLAGGRLSSADLGKIAAQLGTFHAGARSDAETAQFGTYTTIAANVRENFEQTRQSARAFLSEQEFAALERWQLAFLQTERERFNARVAQGRIRDGHGDLRLEHCYLEPDGCVRIIDCIEFNERFRYADVCADVAFLSMDLSWHGRADLSENFLAAYARHSGDYDLYGLVDFYESYRAHVRAKVNSILVDDPGIAGDARERAAAQARKYYLLAEACTREPLERPRLLAVGGMIASGKSTIAERLAETFHAPVIDSDRTRKRLLGVEPLTALADAAFSGAYSPAMTDRTYREVLRCAEIVLRSGRSVVLDASFRERETRAAALELAQRLGLGFLFIECATDEATLRRRLAERATQPSISDGRAELLAALSAHAESVDELPAHIHLRLDTGRPLETTLAELFTHVAP